MFPFLQTNITVLMRPSGGWGVEVQQDKNYKNYKNKLQEELRPTRTELLHTRYSARIQPDNYRTIAPV